MPPQPPPQIYPPITNVILPPSPIHPNIPFNIKNKDHIHMIKDYIANDRQPPWDQFDWPVLLADSPNVTKEMVLAYWRDTVAALQAGRIFLDGDGCENGRGSGSGVAALQGGKVSVVGSGTSAGGAAAAGMNSRAAATTTSTRAPAPSAIHAHTPTPAPNTTSNPTTTDPLPRQTKKPKRKRKAKKKPQPEPKQEKYLPNGERNPDCYSATTSDFELDTDEEEAERLEREEIWKWPRGKPEETYLEEGLRLLEIAWGVGRVGEELRGRWRVGRGHGEG